ncbi:MAG TPA: matrixin family metalloprotease [Polyangiaceae bacterium]
MTLAFPTFLRVTRTAAVALLLLGALEGRASAFCRTTTCRNSDPDDGEESTCDLPPERTDPSCRDNCCRRVIWKRPCVSFSLDISNLRSEQVGPIRDILTAAFETWTKHARCPGTSLAPAITLRDAFGPVLCGHAEYNSTQGNANIITFRKNWPYDPDELGHTVVTYLIATGELVDADIEMNADFKFTTELPTEENDLQSVLTHEIGHFLGIAHNNEPRSLSIMHRYYQAGSDLRALRADDLDALCTMYATPADPSAVCGDFAPRNGFVAECAFDPGSGGWCAAEPVRLPGRGANLALFVCVLVAARALRRRGHQLTR